MKICVTFRSTTSRRGFSSPRGAILLIECLVYIGVLGIIFGLSGLALFRGLEMSRRIHGNTEEISRVLAAGEQWRAEIRKATRISAVRDAPDGAAIRLEGLGEKAIDYALRDRAILRRAGAAGQWIPLLKGVKSSSFARDDRFGLVSWRWELELQGNRKEAHVRPLFTFQAVPTERAAP